MDKSKEGAKKVGEEQTGGLQKTFQDFSRSGDKESDGKTISLKNIDKWLSQANVLGDKQQISNDDTSSVFSKIAKSKDRVDFNEFQQMIRQLAADKKLSANDLTDQLRSAGQPGTTSSTESSSGAARSNLERMTDRDAVSDNERVDQEDKEPSSGIAGSNLDRMTGKNTGSDNERVDQEGRRTANMPNDFTGRQEEDPFDNKQRKDQ